MFCNNCGKQIPDDARFCPNCSAAIGAPPVRKQLIRPRDDRKIAGVCAGVARYFDLNLVAQDDSVDPFLGPPVRNAEFEQNRWSYDIARRARRTNVKRKVRHAQAPPRPHVLSGDQRNL